MDRVYYIISEILGIPLDEINNGIEWDSLTHLHLILALEAEFGVSLPPEDIMTMLSVQQIQIILRKHGVEV